MTAADAAIELVPYAPRGPARFEAERGLLAAALQPWLQAPSNTSAAPRCRA